MTTVVSRQDVTDGGGVEPKPKVSSTLLRGCRRLLAIKASSSRSALYQPIDWTKSEADVGTKDVTKPQRLDAQAGAGAPPRWRATILPRRFDPARPEDCGGLGQSR